MPRAHPLCVASLLLLEGACAGVSDREDPYSAGIGEMAIVQTVPEQGAREVDPLVSLDLCWSTLLDPRSVADTAAAVSSGEARFDSTLTLQLFAWKGPGGAVQPPERPSPWCPGSVITVAPKAPLVHGVDFRLTLPATGVGWEGESVDYDTPGWYRNVDGEWVYVLEFGVAPSPTGGEEIAPAPPRSLRLADLFEHGRVFDPERRACTCHTDPADAALALLDLREPSTAYLDLVGPSRLRDTGFPMVTARKPSESFLVHKLLRDADGMALYGVLGDAMPPTGPLPYADLQDLATWIEGGAAR